MQVAEEIEPVGMLEIAERLGVQAGTVDKWRRRSREGGIRHPMPAARWLVSGYSAWNWHEVEQWAVESGRLRPDGPRQWRRLQESA